MNGNEETNKVTPDELLLFAAGELTGERAEALERAVRDSRLLSREVVRIQGLLGAPTRLGLPRARLATLVALSEAARQGRRRVPLFERLGGLLVARRGWAVAAVAVLLVSAVWFYRGTGLSTSTPTTAAATAPVVDYGALEIDAGLYEAEMNLAAVERLPSVQSVAEPENDWTSDSYDLDRRVEDLRETLDDLAAEMDTV